MSQEIKFLYRKKQYLNQQLYQRHLEGALQHNGMWQHALDYIDEKINRILDNKYLAPNKKLDALMMKKKHTHTQQ